MHGLDGMITAIIQAALRKNGGNVRKTAEELEVSHNTIYRHLEAIDTKQALLDEIHDTVELYRDKEIAQLKAENRRLKELLPKEKVQELEDRWELRKKGESKTQKALAATVC